MKVYLKRKRELDELLGAASVENEEPGDSDIDDWDVTPVESTDGTFIGFFVVPDGLFLDDCAPERRPMVEQRHRRRRRV